MFNYFGTTVAAWLYMQTTSINKSIEVTQKIPSFTHTKMESSNWWADGIELNVVFSLKKEKLSDLVEWLIRNISTRLEAIKYHFVLLIYQESLINAAFA